MENPSQIDADLLTLMATLCHTIAFETAYNSKEAPPAPSKGEMPLDSDLKEKAIEKLFELTRQGRSSEKIASLAESFGLMLVKLETREVRQADLIQALTEQNLALEDARKQLGEQNRQLKTSLRKKYQPARFVGQCPQMEQVKQLALNIARRPINTLILGASGTGKEVFAKMIHFNSPRAGNPFIPVNCTAIPETLFESEMFGINKGVATGVSQRTGIFEQADKGTVFLDEIGDMSLTNQAKLLRVLEAQEVAPVGAAKPVPIDVKVICATHADLKQAVAKGTFREDLYYRLNVVEMTLPLLKDRGEDILILAEKLLAKNCADLGRPPLTLSPEARTCLLAYDWPGNVRELNNEMERAAALTLSARVEASDLSLKLNSATKSAPDTGSAEPGRPEGASGFNLDALKHQTILSALKATGGNRTRAAELLGISREGLRKYLVKTGD